MLKPNVTLTYESLGSGAGQTAIKDKNSGIDFAGSDSILKEEDYENYSELDLQMFPFTGGAVVCNYNLPELNRSRLILSRNVLAEIWLRNITHWDDQRIIDINPELAGILPNQPITLVVRSDNSGTTSIFTSALSKFSDEWKNSWGNFSKWSFVFVNQTNTKQIEGNYGIYSAVLTTPYSLSYISKSYLQVQDYGPYALMINKNGDLVDVTFESLSLAVDDANFNTRFNADLNDPRAAKAWPIAGFSYIIIQKKIDERCNERKEMLKWFNWALTSEEGKARALQKGFIPLTDKVVDQIISLFESLNCSGEPLFVYKPIPQHNGTGYRFFLGLAMFFLLLTIIMGITLLRDKRTSRPGLLYASMLLLGGIITYVSVIFWYLVPDSNYVCQLRQWFTAIGFSVLLTGVFSRTYQIIRVYTYIKRSDKLSTTFIIGMVELGGVVILVTLIQAIILGLWTGIDPWESQKIYVDAINLKFEYGCQCKRVSLWLGLEVALFALILVWGLVVVYSTWKVKESIHESRWLLLSIYNIIVVLAILIPLLATLNASDNTLFYVAAPAICFATTNLVFSVFIPVVMKKVYSSYTSYRTRSSEKRKQSSRKDTGSEGTGTNRPKKNKTKSISKFKIQDENGVTIVEIKDPERQVELPEFGESRMSVTTESSDSIPGVEATSEPTK